MDSSDRIQYLAIGHVSRDVDEHNSEPFKWGGTVSFSSRIAQSLGYESAVLTSAAPDLDIASALPGVALHIVESAESTTFSNIYLPDRRQQIVHALAGWVSAEHLPAGWSTIPIVHLGPITNQIDPELVYAFPNSLIGITPQGWMRAWDERGYVHPIRMEETAHILLPNSDMVIIGEEDLVDDEQLAFMRDLSKILVMTRSAKGCIVFEGDSIFNVPAPSVEEVEPTGAGDIFATAFFIEMHRTGNTLLSAEFANLIASNTVNQDNLEDKITRIKELDLTIHKNR